ncbi:hypothetical protein M5K25_017959 [Dendrobium thyrsiflorum]|uniref:Uncharacterized protein n=1 Tax=Dendrobium thyrsiflorum TaxID=117978 RepID=A0ABD0UH03_DENTH
MPFHGIKLVFNGHDDGVQYACHVSFDGVIYFGVDVEEMRLKDLDEALIIIYYAVVPLRIRHSWTLEGRKRSLLSLRTLLVKSEVSPGQSLGMNEERWAAKEEEGGRGFGQRKREELGFCFPKSGKYFGKTIKGVGPLEISVKGKKGRGRGGWLRPAASRLGGGKVEEERGSGTLGGLARSNGKGEGRGRLPWGCLAVGMPGRGDAWAWERVVVWAGGGDGEGGGTRSRQIREPTGNYRSLEP